MKTQTGHRFFTAGQRTPRPSAARLAGLCSNCRRRARILPMVIASPLALRAPAYAAFRSRPSGNGGSDVRDRPPFRGLRHPGFGRRGACGPAPRSRDRAGRRLARSVARSPRRSTSRRFGLRFVASRAMPKRLARDGTGSQNVREALQRTYAATLRIREWVVAAGRLRRRLRGLRRQLCLRQRGYARHARKSSPSSTNPAGPAPGPDRTP